MGKDSLCFIYASLTAGPPRDVDFCAWLHYLAEQGVNYELHNLDLSTPPETKKLEQIQNKFVYLHIPDVILLPPLLEVLKLLKHNQCFLIVGGDVYIISNPRQILETFPDIDAIIRSPDTGKVLARFQGEKPATIKLDHMQGICYHTKGSEEQSQEIVTLPNPPLIPNLDHLSSLGLYLYGATDWDWFPVIVSHGCETDCQYCGFQNLYLPDENNKLKAGMRREKSAGIIAGEIELLLSKGINRFILTSYELLQLDNSRHIKEIAKEILKRKLVIKFRFTSKPSRIIKHIDSLELLKQAGMDRISIGIDSGLQRFHDMYQTGSTVQDCIDVLKYMHHNRLEFETLFIFFDPYLTVDELKESILFLTRIKRYYSHLSQPFCAHLDSSILNTSLKLRYRTPIIEKLRQDNLVLESPGFSSQPRIKFRDNKVLLIYSVYQALNEVILDKIKPFFYDARLVQQFPFFDTLLLNVLAELVLIVNQQKYNQEKDYLFHMVWIIKDALKPMLAGIFSNFPRYNSPELVKLLLT